MRPAHHRVVWGGAAVLAVLAAVAQLPIVDRNFVSMDEGHLALTASRLLDGDLLYRDIHTGIFPGIYLVTAALFDVFGTEVLVTRWAQLVVNAATVALLWGIGLRILPPRWAVLPAVGFVALVWISFPVLTMFNYAALSGVFGLAALLMALRYLDTGEGRFGMAVGLLVGLCLFTKQNYGGLAAVAIALGLLLARPGSALAARSVVALFRPIVLAGSAFLVVAIGWLALTGTLLAWIDLTFLSLVGPQLASFDNPIPPILGAHPQGDGRFIYLYIPSSLFDLLLRGDRFAGVELSPGVVSASIRLVYGLPIAALIAASARLAWQRPSEGTAEQRAQRGSAVLVVTYAVGFFFGIFPSAVYSHLAYVMAPVLLLFAWLGASLEAGLENRGLARGWYATSCAVALLVLSACATLPAHIRQSYATPSGLPQVGIQVSPGQAELHAQALGFIGQCAGPNEPIFTLPILPVLYLASGHPNPVKWDLLIPGAIDEAVIIQALARDRVRCVVRQRDMNPEFPPLEVLYPSLHRYIATNYAKGRALRGAGQVWFGLVRTTPFEAPGGSAR